MITLNSENFLQAVKTGIAKVKDASVSISAEASKLNLNFIGSSVQYQTYLTCSKGNLAATSFDAALLLKIVNTKSQDIVISQDGPELKFKAGRTIVKLSSSPYVVDDLESRVESDIPVSTDTFTGWTKKHPLYSAISLKRSLQAIKDNITKSELVVEAQWGGDNLLKVKLVDQFHGILCVVKLDNIPTKKSVHIRLPLSSFLLMMDIKGDLYIDHSKVIVKDDDQTLTCFFVAATSFGSIEDMLSIVKVKAQMTCEAKELIQAVKQVISITEPDDAINFAAKEGKLTIAAQAVKGSMRTSIKATGKFNSSFSLPPKNLQDIVSCLSKTAHISDIGTSLVLSSVNEDITVHGALVKLEA